MSRGAETGPDGVLRCPWGNTPAEYQRYHDHEWGRPVGDDERIFEKLCLEGFQGGLSWLTILRKREGFRAAFARFDPRAVAGFEEDDIERLLRDASIVRNRAKITATIENARAMVRLAGEGLSLAALVWQHEPAASAPPKQMADVPAITPASKALSAALRKHGFRFVGPTTVYAAMQSLGVVNDHLAGCEYREACDTERSAFTRPG
jgi:DNA-3-methyladenine glycosylase I